MDKVLEYGDFTVNDQNLRLLIALFYWHNPFQKVTFNTDKNSLSPITNIFIDYIHFIALLLHSS